MITPRFAPSCSENLLAELGKLAKEMDLPIQSHLCEQKEEITYTLGLFPGHKNCTSIFSKAGMVHNKVGQWCLNVVFLISVLAPALLVLHGSLCSPGGGGVADSEREWCGSSSLSSLKLMVSGLD